MEELISLFYDLTGEKPMCQMLKGEGSNRQYFRLVSPSHSFIGVKGESTVENHTFIVMAKHFAEKGLNTPKVLAASPDELYYLQEDLGDESLFHAISNDISSHSFEGVSLDLLKKTMAKLADFQFKAAEGFDFSVCYPIPSMDRQSILWDLNYFKYCFLKLAHVDFLELDLEKDFQQLTNDLLQFDSNTFLYRDFQSRNVMIKNGDPYFIDFQGGRRGPIYYDVASFVWQAKANYPKETKNQLIDAYLQSLKKYQLVDESSFHSALSLFVLFRLIQVLGAYGYRGLFEKKKHFIESIPMAFVNVKELLQEHDFNRYPYLVSLLEKLSNEPSFQPSLLPDATNLTVKVYSFSYKKGIPADDSGNGGGYVFDCRGVHNPGKYDQYKPLTGLDQPVIDFLEKDGEILKFLESVYALADAHVLRYMERGFTSLMFSFGCTGGRHRSVYSAQHVAEHIANKFGVKVVLCHREHGIEKVYNS